MADLVNFRGEKMTRRELARRYVALHPTEGGCSLAERIKAETGVAVCHTEVTKIRMKNGLPKLGRRGKPESNGHALPMPINEVVSAAVKATETQATRIVSVVKSLRDCLNILGSKDAVKQVLDAL